MREPLGIVLAGGRGSRMGQITKADLKLGEETLLARVEGRLAPQCHDVVVVANAPVQTKRAVIKDSIPGFLGPLAGILAGLKYAAGKDYDHIVTVAVDTPFFPCDLTPNLILAGGEHPLGFAIAAGSDGLHGTFGLWPVALTASLETFLNDGNRKVRTFTEANNACTALFPTTDPDMFFNINTFEQLKDAETWI